MRHKVVCYVTLVLGVCGLCVAADNGKAASPPAAEWLTSVPKAFEEAKKCNRLILADFTGSDWCGWCQKLKAEVFDTPEFKAWAAKNVILLELDFPRSKPQDDATKKQNREMMQKYGVSGFPTILFLKPDGTKVGTMGYQSGGPKPWTEKAQKIIDTAK
jgi:thioredoxin-related protein